LCKRVFSFYAMNQYKGLHSFLTSALNWSGQLHALAVSLRRNNHGILSIRGLVESQSRHRRFSEDRITLYLPEFEPRTIHPIAKWLYR
jgi:hypothetical protein